MFVTFSRLYKTYGFREIIIVWGYSLGTDHAKLLNSIEILPILLLGKRLRGRKRPLNLPLRKTGKTTVKNPIYI